ncbi:MAG: RloB family protein [Clostridiales bacterium]|nr:RloB family protein [Clostridiales bacterium]
MRKEYNPDHVRQRKRRSVIYIICEGKETEINYFRHFRTRRCLVDVVPISSKHTAAEHLVKHARALISHADYFPQDGDQIWCVFDCDENSDAALRNAAGFAKQNGYRIAYSNPCFEYWYLLHFVKQTGYLKDADEVVHLLQGRGWLEKYAKNLDVFQKLLPYQSKAIQRAKERIEQLSRDDVAILSRGSNPVTTVHDLVEYLNKQNV